MIDPLFWLGLSLVLVAASLTAVLVALIPAVQELARAARSAEKLFDTLSRELPPTLEAIRLTGLEISDLTDDMSEGVRNAGDVVRQVDQSIAGVRKQAQKVHVTTRGLAAGLKAAWKTFTRQSSSSASRRFADRLPPMTRTELDFRATQAEAYHLETQWSEEELWFTSMGDSQAQEAAYLSLDSDLPVNDDELEQSDRQSPGQS